MWRTIPANESFGNFLFVLLLYTLLLGLVVVLGVCACCEWFEPKTPAGIPWVGRRKERFSYLRAKWRTGWNINVFLREANQYLDKGQPVKFAHLIGPPQVIIPPGQIRWMITQPDSVISQDIQADGVHRFIGSGLAGDNTAPDILRRKLARDLDDKIPILNDEICASLDELWGKSGEWQRIDLKSTLRVLNARVGNRILVGESACRDRRYIDSVLGFTKMHANATTFYHALPSTLIPVVAFVVRTLTNRYISTCSKVLFPVLQQRILDVSNAASTDGVPTQSQPHSDFLTWLVERLDHRGESLHNLHRSVASNMLILNIAAVEVSTFALNSAVRDLVRAEKDGHLAPVIEEATAVLTACNFRPEKSDVVKMVRIEKAMKESLRRGVQVGFMRQVTAPQGVELRDGTHLPCGTRVCINALGIHFNDENYANAKDWNPDREEESQPSAPVKTHGSDVSLMNKPSETYLSFGLGRRACPGRYVATHQMKISLAQIFSKYDIKIGRDEKRKEDDVYIRRKPGT